MTLLRDVIDIPDEVRAGDYVLALSEGIGDLDRTVGDYVVTPALAKAFDSALGLVESAVTSGRSRAAFLHGSFGTGKSHFMAVLYALLGGNAKARGLPELAAVVARHDPVLQGRRFLRLTFHLIGAGSLEEAVLGGYARQVGALHPEATLPPIHQTDALFTNAEGLRERIGTEPFLDGLNGGGGGVWDRFAGRWTVDSYQRAAAAAPGDPERTRLADALIRTFFTSFPKTAGYVDLDSGLRLLTEHAKSLGYHGVILLLDELILWLATRLTDRNFIATEGSKVAKLVESADAHRAVPLVSFIARQRDLRDFLGDTAPGAEQSALSDTLRWWEDRFDRITLGDENLPYIANRRLLRPRDKEAESILDEAFEEVDRSPEIWNVLLDGVNTGGAHRGADQRSFRLTYPFSPAFMNTLLALSGLLQRERTALKVMQQILVDQRDELTVDDVVPVGDLFYQIVEGTTALMPETERRFAAARRLYREKVRPMLLGDHGLNEETAAAVGYRHPFRNDDRLVKTLLLAELTPGVPALRDLTPSRLASLNHGTITSMLRGEEATTVLGKLKRWRPKVPELQLKGDDRNPTVTIRVAEVDYQSVLDRVLTEDSVGARRMLLKELVWTSLGIRYDPAVYGFQEHMFVWRGSRRQVDVIFDNVRDKELVPKDLLVHDSKRWRVVIDYPFDEDGRFRSDDFARMDQLRTAVAKDKDEPPRTVAWLPRFLTPERLQDLGRLVLLEYLLSGNGERFDASADHLSATDRVQAKGILENLRVSTREQLSEVLKQAYGAATARSGDVDLDDGEDRVLVFLDQSFPPSELVGADLAKAFGSLVDQLLAHTWPAHPDFRTDRPDARNRELKLVELQLVLSYVQKARQQPNGRVAAEPGDRPVLRRVAGPLGIGALHENHYVLDLVGGFPWRNRFAQCMSKDGMVGPVTVGRLREWTDADAKRGLDRNVANLVIASWALATDRAWFQYDQPLPAAPSLERITDDMELREQRLPEQEAWDAALRRAGALFGVPGNPYRTAANVAAFATRVRQAAAGLVAPADRLVDALERHQERLGLAVSAETGRLATARAAAELVHRLTRTSDDVTLVEALDGATLPADDLWVARSLTTAEPVTRALAGTAWTLVDSLDRIADDRQPDARRLLAKLAETGRLDEFQADLAKELRWAQDRATRLLARSGRPAPQPAPPAGTAQPVPADPQPTPITLSGQVDGRVGAAGQVAPSLPTPEGDPAVVTVLLEWPADLDAAVARLRGFVAANPGRRVRVRWQVEE